MYNKIQHALNEVTVLKSLHNPYLVKLKTTFQDRRRIYLVFELIPGGELF